MFFVKEKSKRKNVITCLTVLLLMVGGILLESTLSEKSQVADCACPGETQITTQQEAGWFFGKHCKNGVERYRVFGIGVGRARGCCGTYQ